MLQVDTNVLVDVLEDDPVWADWSTRQLRAQAQVHALFINPVIYSELSLAFESVQALDDTIENLDLGYEELPRPALFLAGRAFVKYRREGGTKTNVLSDFFIGAHAAVQGCAILTRDARRYRNYFPGVVLIDPEGQVSPCIRHRIRSGAPPGARRSRHGPTLRLQCYVSHSDYNAIRVNLSDARCCGDIMLFRPRRAAGIAPCRDGRARSVHRRCTGRARTPS